MRRPVFCLLLGVFSLPISAVPAQIFLYLSLLLWLGDWYMNRGFDVFKTGLTRWALGFTLIAALSILWSLDPVRSADKLYRLVLFLFLFSVPMWLHERDLKGETLLTVFLAGLSVLALFDGLRCLTWLSNWQGMGGLIFEELLKKSTVTVEAPLRERIAFQDLGNIRDPQFYMVGISILAAALLLRRRLLPVGFVGAYVRPAGKGR